MKPFLLFLVCVLFPTVSGSQQLVPTSTTLNQAWEADAGPWLHARIDEVPPDDDSSFVAATSADFVFKKDHRADFGISAVSTASDCSLSLTYRWEYTGPSFTAANLNLHLIKGEDLPSVTKLGTIHVEFGESSAPWTTATVALDATGLAGLLATSSPRLRIAFHGKNIGPYEVRVTSAFLSCSSSAMLSLALPESSIALPEFSFNSEVVGALPAVGLANGLTVVCPPEGLLGRLCPLLSIGDSVRFSGSIPAADSDLGLLGYFGVAEMVVDDGIAPLSFFPDTWRFAGCVSATTPSGDGVILKLELGQVARTVFCDAGGTLGALCQTLAAGDCALFEGSFEGAFMTLRQMRIDSSVTLNTECTGTDRDDGR